MKNWKLIFLLNIFSLTFLIGSPTKSELDNMVKIVGYFPNWGVYRGHRNYEVKHIPFDKLTHVQLAFADITDDYDLKSPDDWADLQNPFGEKWGSEYVGNYGQLKKFKKQYPHISVLLSVGGWTLSSKFTHIAREENSRKVFAKNVVAYMKAYDFDGIDIDWEFPTKVRLADKIDLQSDQGTPDSIIEDKENFTLLMKDLREEIDKQSAIDNKYYQLTAAVGASEALIDGTNPKDYAQYLDFINIMSYDLHGAWENRTNHQSPIYKNPNLPDDKLTLENAVDYLISKGIDSKKLIAGSPFYSRGWKGVECEDGAIVTYLDSNYSSKTKVVSNVLINNQDGSILPGLYCYASGGAKGLWDGGRPAGVNSYYDVIKVLESDNSFTKYRDNYSKVPYLYSETKKEFYTYEDEVSAQARAQFVKDKNLGGIIFWELSADTRVDKGDENKSLLTAIYNKLYDTGTDVIDTVTNIQPEPIDTTSQQDVEEEKSDKGLDNGAAVGELNIIAEFDVNHTTSGEESHGPHYNTGEIVLYNDGTTTYECTAKWWVFTSNPLTSQAWDCISTSEIIKVDNTAAEKEDIKNKADAIADNYIDGSEPNDTADETLLDANNPDNTTTADTNTQLNFDSPTLEEIKEAEDELAKCAVGKVYNTGDVCLENETWYKFKWWTKYDGTVQSSMEITTSENAPQVSIIPAKDLSNWSNSLTYSKKGMRVVFEGSVFESKYWTSGDKPLKFNDNSPWQYIGIADLSIQGDAGESAPLASEIENGTVKANEDEPIIVANDEKNTTATYDPNNGDTVVSQGVDFDTKNDELESNLNSETPSNMVFRPFVDAVSWPPYNPKESGAFDIGIKHYVFSFINSNGNICSPRWGEYDAYTIDNKILDIPNKITEVRKNGGSSMVSFGGAIAHGTELPNVCNTVEELADAYQEVVDKLGVKLLDFDIEGENSYKKLNVLKRMKALKLLKDRDGYGDLKISFTLAVMPTGLLADSGLMILKTAIQEGVQINMVNLMLMDYGTSFPSEIRNQYKMVAYSIKAIESLNTQLKAILINKEIYPEVNNNYYHLIGAIPMIGRNDTLVEWFYPEDIVKLVEFSTKKGLGMLSMWSLNRDKPISDGEPMNSQLYKSTKLSNEAYTNSFDGMSEFGYAKELLKGEN